MRDCAAEEVMRRDVATWYYSICCASISARPGAQELEVNGQSPNCCDARPNRPTDRPAALSSSRCNDRRLHQPIIECFIHKENLTAKADHQSMATDCREAFADDGR